MKKILSLFLVALIALGLVGCTAASEKETTTSPASSAEPDTHTQETVQKPSEGRVLVAYFSVTGHTKAVAEKIASVTNADLYEIRPAIAYTDADINYGDSDSRTSKEQNDSSVRPEIGSEPIALEDYDTVYIGYPIWWGEEPRIMDTFVERYDFGDITVIPFCTSGSSGIGNSGNNLSANAGSGHWLEGKRFDSAVSESDISAWIRTVQ